MNSTNSRSPSRNEQKEKKKDRLWSKSSVIVNGVLVLISAGIYWMATQQTKDFERFSKIDLRAYIVIEDTGITITSSHNKLSTTVWFSNIGKTPASDFFHVNICVPMYVSVIDDFEKYKLGEFFKEADRHKNEGITIGGNITEPKIGYYDPATISDSIKISHGVEKFVILGVMGYNDVFNTYHRTWYCFESDTLRSGVAKPEYSGTY